MYIAHRPNTGRCKYPLRGRRFLQQMYRGCLPLARPIASSCFRNLQRPSVFRRMDLQMWEWALSTSGRTRPCVSSLCHRIGLREVGVGMLQCGRMVGGRDSYHIQSECHARNRRIHASGITRALRWRRREEYRRRALEPRIALSFGCLFGRPRFSGDL